MKDRVIYQIVTDRFADREGRALKGLGRSAPAKAWRQYAGGHYSGIRERLPYLKALGVGAIWLSPLVENSHLPAARGKARQDGYHGYWARDFERLNPHFGNEQELQLLLQECAQSDLRAILDVVLNHTNPTYSNDGGDLYRDGELFARYSHDTDACFHHRGDLDQSQEYDSELWENCNLWGLADLAQETPKVWEYLCRSYQKWIELGFTGARLDAALHVPADYLAKWRLHIETRVPACDFFVGEWWNGGPTDLISSKAANISGLHLTDFQFAHALRAWLAQEKTIDSLWPLLEACEGLKAPELKLNFFDNHDMPRLLSLLWAAEFPPEKARSLLAVAVATLMLWPGIPCIYYGTETAVFCPRKPRRGKPGHDPYNRDAMDFSSTDTRIVEILREFSRLRKTEAYLEDTLKVTTGPDQIRLKRGTAQLRLRLNSSGGLAEWKLSVKEVFEFEDRM